MYAGYIAVVPHKKVPDFLRSHLPGFAVEASLTYWRTSLERANNGFNLRQVWQDGVGLTYYVEPHADLSGSPSAYLLFACCYENDSRPPSEGYPTERDAALKNGATSCVMISTPSRVLHEMAAQRSPSYY